MNSCPLDVRVGAPSHHLSTSVTLLASSEVPLGHRAPRRGGRQMTDTQKNQQEHLSLQCELELGKSKAVRKPRVRVWRRGWSVGRLEEALSSLQPE